MLNAYAECHCAQCHHSVYYPECYYAECPYGESRGAVLNKLRCQWGESIYRKKLHLPLICSTFAICTGLFLSKMSNFVFCNFHEKVIKSCQKFISQSVAKLMKIKSPILCPV